MAQFNQVGADNGGPATSPAATGATGTATTKSQVNGGRFDFDDGGTYCGGWEDGKAHGHGVCTGPKGQGAYSGSWHYGFEVSGVYTWPSGSCFEGQWQNGKRHGLGVETRGRWIYRGEWTQGFKGRYGVRQSNTSTAKYEGTWASGLQDGYGSETYADDGTYQGQWMRGMRHGYGIRKSAPFGKASKYRADKALRASLTSLRSNEGQSGANPEPTDKRDRRVDDSRGGFVLKMNSTEPTVRRRSLGGGNPKKGLFTGLILKKQRSTGDLGGKGGNGSIRSTGSSASWVSSDSAQSAVTNASIPSDSNASFVIEDESMDPGVTETYMGEWKNDKRSGYGVSERSDGLKYEGEWYANKKYGYGVTTLTNGDREEGKYKNNVLITSQKKKLFLMRSAKFRERIDAAVNAAQRASKIALQKSDIAINRTATARGKAEQADIAAAHAREDSDIALTVAKQYAPDFKQPDIDRVREKMRKHQMAYNINATLHSEQNPISNPINQIPNSIQKPIPNHIPSQPDKIPPNQMNRSVQNPNQSANALPPNTYTTQVNQNMPEMTNSNYVNAMANNPYNNPTKQPYMNEIGPKPMGQNLVENNPGNEYTSPIAKPRNSLPGDGIPNNTSLPKRTRRISADRPSLASIGKQSSKDHNEIYNRPRSRDPSVDKNGRYNYATERLNNVVNMRQPSVDRSSAHRPSETPDRTTRAPSAVRGTTPIPNVNPLGARNGSVVTGNAAKLTSQNSTTTQPPPFEDVILRNRGLGQDIVPSPNQPKRTESLFIPGQPMPAAKVNTHQNLVTQTSLQRKKSLPDFQDLPRATGAMSREEVSYLGSARREEVRRQHDENERLRANPLLYLVSPQVKDWFSRQQLVLVVLFVNISLAIMFFKLLT